METKEPFVVKNAQFPTIRLVDEIGTFHQSISTYDALTKAKISNLDLVCFNEPEDSKLALCKIIDFGKWKYNFDKSKKKAEKQQQHETKEVWFSPSISSHDIEHKVKQIKRFIEEGHNVVINMQIKTSMNRHIAPVHEKTNEIMSICSEFSKELSRKQTDNRIYITLSKK